MAEHVPKQKKPLLAALLQMTCLVGGLGYLYLGQGTRFIRTFLVVLVLVGLSALAASNDVSDTGALSENAALWKTLAKAMGPAIFVTQLLTAVDAWTLARKGDYAKNESSMPILERL